MSKLYCAVHAVFHTRENGCHICAANRVALDKAVAVALDRGLDGAWHKCPGGCGSIVGKCKCKLASVAEQENERGAGLKFDSGKGRWTLLMAGMPKALAGIVDVLGFGAKKYAAHSWREVENNTERYRDALYRHLAAIETGELVDPESGLSHWDHVATNVLFLSELSKAEK